MLHQILLNLDRNIFLYTFIYTYIFFFRRIIIIIHNNNVIHIRRLQLNDIFCIFFVYLGKAHRALRKKITFPLDFLFLFSINYSRNDSDKILTIVNTFVCYQRSIYL